MIMAMSSKKMKRSNQDLHEDLASDCAKVSTTNISLDSTNQNPKPSEGFVNMTTLRMKQIMYWVLSYLLGQIARNYKREKNDPRGCILTHDEALSSTYCEHCSCHKKICHGKRFGLFLGLRVAEIVQQHGVKKTYIEKLMGYMKTAYNEIIRITVFLGNWYIGHS